MFISDLFHFSKYIPMKLVPKEQYPIPLNSHRLTITKIDPVLAKSRVGKRDRLKYVRKDYPALNEII